MPKRKKHGRHWQLRRHRLPESTVFKMNVLSISWNFQRKKKVDNKGSMPQIEFEKVKPTA